MDIMKQFEELLAAQVYAIEKKAQIELHNFADQAIECVHTLVLKQRPKHDVVIDNDNTSQPPTKSPRKAASAPAPARKAGGKRLFTNEMFLNTLTDEFQSQKPIHTKLEAIGITMSQTTVKNNLVRMAEAGLVEQDGANHKWKLLDQSTTATDNVVTIKAKAAAKGNAKRTYRKVKVTRTSTRGQLVAANDREHVANDNEQVRLILGDCLEEMRNLPDESIDLIITSPPYNLREIRGKNSGWKGSKLRDGYENYSDDMPYPDYIAWQKAFLTECWRLIKPTGAIYYNHKPRIIGGVLRDPANDLNPGLPIRQKIVWDRGTGMNHSPFNHLNTHEEIIVFAKPEFRLKEKNGTKSVFRINPETAKNKHAAPFPLELPMTIINAAERANVILDPFMGSGTTGVAAVRAGKQFIGIELGPQTLASAKQRIEVEQEEIALAISDPITVGLHQGDCVKLLRRIPTGSIPLILVDPPYGTTNATTPDKKEKIDVKLDAKAVWVELERILTKNGTVLMFASEPFSTEMVNAAPISYVYRNIWRKSKPTGFAHARNKPLKDYEDILVFTKGVMGHERKAGKSKNGTSDNRMTFNPWQAIEVEKVNRHKLDNRESHKHIKEYVEQFGESYDGLNNCPRMVFEYAKEFDAEHCFQKPQALLNDLIRMYSNPGDVVLDYCIGSGSTAVAAINAERRWIGFEQTNYYYKVAKDRIEAAEAAIQSPK